MNKKIILGILLLLLVGSGLGLALFTVAAPILQTPAAIGPARNYATSAAGDSTIDTAALICHDPDDTDNIYADYDAYIFEVNITLEMKYTDICATNMTLNATKATTEYWSVAWTAPNTFAESAGTTKIELLSSTNSTGNVSATVTYINFTIVLRTTYTMDTVDDVDLGVKYGNGTGADSDVSTGINTSANYDYVGQLDISSSTLYVNSEEEQKEACLLNTMTYLYYGSTDNYPLENETDFWISRAAVAGQGIVARYDEEISYVESTGVATFEFAEPAVDEDTTDTATIYAVAQSGGSGDTSLMHTSHTDTITVSRGPPHGGVTTIDPFVDPVGWLLGTTEGLVVLIGSFSAVFVVLAIVISKTGASVGMARRRPKRKTTKSKRRR